jgi:hypothetical protein
VRSVLIAVSCALALPPVCFAHGGGSEHGYVSTVERIVNANGIEVATGDEGHFSFTAPAGKTVVVRGYGNEPYVRFHGGSIAVNDLAPTTYANDDQPRPKRADPKAAPVWREVDHGLTYDWHDHRTRWMAAEAPAAVRAKPNAAHHISDWQVTGTVDGEPFAVQGALDWSPKKSGPGYEWISFLAIGAAVLYGAFLLFARRARPDKPHGQGAGAGS